MLHLQQVRHWRLVGFTVREGQKGVMADGTSDTVVQDLTVTEIGDEAVHLRAPAPTTWCAGSPSPTPACARIKFGEGIYVGSAVSNWCDISDCEPDRSDHNVIVANTISRTTAESVDIKEGTTGGVLADNTFDGAGMPGDADSWVDVKGNGWLVQANRGTDHQAVRLPGQPAGRRLGHRQHLRRQHRRRPGPGYGYELRAADRRGRAQPRHLHQHRHRRRQGPDQHHLRLTPPAGRPSTPQERPHPQGEPMNTTTSAHPTPTDRS